MEGVHNKIKIRITVKKNQMTNLPLQPGDKSCKSSTSSHAHKQLNLKMIHASINFSFPVPFESAIELDLPILNNYGALEIFFSETSRTPGFLPNIKDPQVSSFHIPIQTIYNMIYNRDKLKRKNVTQAKGQQSQSSGNISSNFHFKQKMVELKNTKVSVTLEYKGRGNTQSYWSCQPKAIYESDPQPE